MIENDLFDYGIKILQSQSGYKFNLDSILLAEFVKFKPESKILDLCSGNAVIPLILSTKNNKLNIDSVEIQKDKYELAKKNISINNLNNRINTINIDLKEYTKFNYYDVVICNPPYYKWNENIKNTSDSISKYEIKTSIEEIIKYSKKFLNPKGNLFLIYRVERLGELVFISKKYNFGIQNITFLITSRRSSAKLFLINLSKLKKDNIKIEFKNIYDLKSYKNIFD